MFCAVNYRQVAKKLIFVLKYQPYISDIQHILVDLLYESIIQKEVFIKNIAEKSVLIPVPLSAKKLKQRGYNQSFLLAKGLSKKLRIPVVDILVRTKHTKPQFGLSKEERKLNMKHAFSIKKGVAIIVTAKQNVTFDNLF